jgi:hypothetical protein
MTRWPGALALLSMGMVLAGTIQAAPPDSGDTLLDRVTKRAAFPMEELWSDRPYYWLAEDEILTFKRTGVNRFSTYMPVQRNLKPARSSYSAWQS